jgi:thioredoxin-related protein|tara:strand:+ start:2143 stop:2646 length:504 start_codon:yes stop_codon:yes gene_type:complete
MKNYLIGFCLLTFSLLSQVTGASEVAALKPLPQVYLEKFERLDSPKRETLKDFYGSAMAIAVFSTDCSWCKKQHRVLKSLQNECPQLTSVMMGIGDDKRKLTQDLRRSKNEFPAFQINSKLLNALDNSNVPRLLVFDRQGIAQLNLSGFIPKDELLALLNQQLDQDC